MSSLARDLIGYCIDDDSKVHADQIGTAYLDKSSGDQAEDVTGCIVT